MAWQITWRGTTWNEADLTVGHIATIIDAQGVDSWSFLNPFDGPVKLMGVLAALIAVSERRPAAEVLAELATAPAIELLSALTTVDLDDIADNEAIIAENTVDA